jgi:hypothetical protein
MVDEVQTTKQKADVVADGVLSKVLAFMKANPKAFLVVVGVVIVATAYIVW